MGIVSILVSLFVIPLLMGIAYLTYTMVIQPKALFDRFVKANASNKEVGAFPFVPFIGQFLLVLPYLKSDNMLALPLFRAFSVGYVHIWAQFNLLTLQVSDPDYLWDIWREASNWCVKGNVVKAFISPLVGATGVLCTENPRHMQMRNATVSHVFSPNVMNNLFRMFNSNIQTYFNESIHKNLKNYNKNETITIELLEWISNLSLKIIVDCSFGPNVPDIVYKAFSDLAVRMRAAASSSSLIDKIPVLRQLFQPIINLLHPPPKTQGDPYKEVHEALDNIIDQRRKATNLNTNPESNDLLDVLLTAKVDNIPFNNVDVRTEASGYITAGHMTTGSMMCWALYEVIRRPELFSQIRQEVDSLSKDKFSIDSQDLSRLVWTSATIDETLRYYPPVHISMRESVQDYECKPDSDTKKAPLFIPKGLTVVSDIMVLHRRIEYWGPEAELFDPARWVKGHRNYHPPTTMKAYLPFGPDEAGARWCLGRALARNQAITVLAYCVKYFDFQLLPGQNVVVDVVINLCPKYGIKASIKPRQFN